MRTQDFALPLFPELATVANSPRVLAEYPPNGHDVTPQRQLSRDERRADRLALNYSRPGSARRNGGVGLY